MKLHGMLKFCVRHCQMCLLKVRWIFLNKFNQAKPEQAVDFSFDFTKLEPFTHDINHSRAYREDDDFIVETSEKEVYRFQWFVG